MLFLAVSCKLPRRRDFMFNAVLYAVVSLMCVMILTSGGQFKFSPRARVRAISFDLQASHGEPIVHHLLHNHHLMDHHEDLAMT